MIANLVRAVSLAAFLVALPLASAAPAPAGPSDEQLKEKLLKLNELTGADAMQAGLTELIKDKELTKQMVALAAKMQKEAKEKEKPFKFQAALILAKASHNVKQNDNAELFYRAAADSATSLKSGSKMLQAYEGLMDLYWDQKKFKDVEEVCQTLMETRGEEIDKAKPFVLEKLVQSKAKQGDTDEALRMAEGLVQLDQGGWYFLQLKGWVQREAGKTDDAIATYEDVIDKVEENKGLKDDMKSRLKKNARYIISGLHVDNNNIDKAADQLKKLIKEDPENPTFYNDLGFVWADHDKNLKESEEMIRKALELDAKARKKLLDEGKIDAEIAKKENAAYLDSLGWVLYKRGNLKEAKKYLQDAVKDDEEGAHIEIWDHLADVQLALGETDAAIAVWVKALKLEDVSKRDAERRKKITEKLKKARAMLKDKEKPKE